MHPFSEQTPPPPTPPPKRVNTKHTQCSCSLLKQPWQNILTRRLLLALLCKVVIRECFSPSRICDKNLGHFEAVLAGIVWGGNNGYYVPNKIYAAALSLYKDLSPLQWLPPQSAFPNHTDVLVDTGQTLLRWLMDGINEFSWSVTQIKLRNLWWRLSDLTFRLMLRIPVV